MNTIFLYRLGGLAMVLAGVCLWVDAALGLLQVNATVGFCFVAPTLGLFGLTTMYFFQGEKSGNIGLMAYILSFISLCGFIGIAVNNNLFGFMIDAEKMKEFLSGSSHFVFVGFGLLFILGSILMSVTVWISDRFPKFTSILYLVGAIPLALPTVMPNILVEAGAVSVGIAVVSWGFTLLVNKDELAMEVVV